MTLEKESFGLLQEALAKLEEGFHSLPKVDPSPHLESLRTVLLEVAERMQDNYPYPHPLYVGQMLKPPTEIARLAYMLSLWINPNNHALDGGRASSAMEKEAVAEIAKMFGWETHLGHLCGGGTMANLEGLWVAGNLQPNKKVVASSQSHYTHSRICGVLGLPFQSISCDSRARMDIAALKKLLQEDDIGTVVVTIGTTATGSVDPLPEILELQAEYGFRIHADSAYGGYFTLVSHLDGSTRAAFDCLKQVDSIVIDPHKHGLQPYGCGCILFKDPAVGKLYKHDSPYTYFSSEELHLGEISLECSRPGSSAVALWATQRLLPLIPGGQFADSLSKSRTAALTLFEKLQNDSRFIVAFPPELDIVIWAVKSQSASESSRLAKEIFKVAGEENLHLALANVSQQLFVESGEGINWDQDSITCLRSCLIKPEHLDWLERIWQILDSVTNKVIPTS
ncbi:MULTISPECIES: aminotransferase class I/II-fold pyridoxal phosphate-dependent enzyme [unclassified Nodularia (in: cyanobacteria)]|uniref:pyridoxal phosphate-dependent decarboxylase family protein n=1 Tax=unclassified Nodularia (in: cyanobacteria) TaxID=2656917 RepID=UPI0018827EA7|nr:MULTISPECIES: aminotransferase class I/II-fold pyridoxal phosphate-dependent enzyme [unclassified Nodularia (in: cyanobacteria)]MBE9197862.1 aspartate aminotransferase family protein [Nodularia sp. LEGE 06071]MCC2694612.1 aspartate aminotransferase family protein [Nodularia sp. LEGE 04288]